MSEIDLLRRIEALEKKVEELETTINTIGMIEKSERISEFLRQRKRNQSLVSLVNSMSDEEIVISSTESEHTQKLEKEREHLESHIKEALVRENTVTNQAAENEQLFSIVNYRSYVEITGYNGFNANTIVIPSRIKEKPVIKIGDNAFKNSPCKHIVISDSVIEIGNNAFSDSKNLQSVQLGSRTKTIGDWAFSRCTELKAIDLPESLLQIGSYCFSNSGIERIVIPSSLQTIPNGCFSDCSRLRELIISEGVLYVEKNVFGFSSLHKTSLTDIVFPKSLKVINIELFGSSSNRNCKLVFLGNNTDWKCNSSFNFARHTVYCAFGSRILQSSRQFGCEVHPLSEYLENR